MPTQWVTYSPRAPSSVSIRTAQRCADARPLPGDQVADAGRAMRRQAEAFHVEAEQTEVNLDAMELNRHLQGETFRRVCARLLRRSGQANPGPGRSRDFERQSDKKPFANFLTANILEKQVFDQ